MTLNSTTKNILSVDSKKKFKEIILTLFRIGRHPGLPLVLQHRRAGPATSGQSGNRRNIRIGPDRHQFRPRPDPEVPPKNSGIRCPRKSDLDVDSSRFTFNLHFRTLEFGKRLVFLGSNYFILSLCLES